MVRVTADKNIPFIRGVLDPFANVSYLHADNFSPAIIKNSDALLVRTRTICNRDLLEGSRVKFIATATIGTDHIDLEYCQSRGIQVVSAPGCNAASVNQYIAAVLAWLTRNHEVVPGETTIGIIGVGNVGSKVAVTARSFGLVPLLNDPPRERREGRSEFVALEDILNKSDIISLHVPLTREGRDVTFHMVDEDFLARAKKMRTLINTARGAVCSTGALRQKFAEGGNLVLDVWENEPDIDQGLLQVSSFATPHIAGYSIDGKANASIAVIRACSSYFGFGLDDWSPPELPGTANRQITIDGQNLNDSEIVAEAVKQTYDLPRDDQWLRNKPGRFEQFRDNYPVRREFPYFECYLKNARHSAVTALTLLGFRTIVK